MGLKSTGSNEEESKSDDGIVEIFMRSDEMSLEQVERCIDKATVIACGGCDQIGRSYRKLKDLPPVFKCESSPCEHYLCAWCGIAGLKAFAGNRDQAVVHEIRCKHRRGNWNEAARAYIIQRTEKAMSKASIRSKEHASRS